MNITPSCLDAAVPRGRRRAMAAGAAVPPIRAARRVGTVVWVGVVALAACSGPSAPPAWSGYVEGETLYLAAPVAGTLATLAVQAGQTVAAGAPLFRLDDTVAAAARAEADARLVAAQAQADNGLSGRRAPERAAVAAQLAQARSAADRAATELQRQQALHAQGFIAAARLDDAATAARQARERVAELQASLRSAEQPAARPDETRAARASTEAAAQARAQALWREQQARQSAPAAGLVTEVYFRPGEYVGAGQPVLALLPPAARKARFFVPEAERGALAVGQRVSLACDGCGAPIPARIQRLAAQAEYTPPVIYSNSQRARLVFLAEAQPEQPADALRLHPGQPLDVRAATAP